MSLGALSHRWLPPLLLMAVIFLLSAQPNLDSGLGTIDLIGRKLVHAGEYALLCFLWWRALATVTGVRAAILAALAVAIAYAASDELHQAFVPTRTGTPVDVAIDAAGASLAALVLWRRTGAHRPAGRREPRGGRSRLAADPGELDASAPPRGRS